MNLFTDKWLKDKYEETYDKLLKKIDETGPENIILVVDPLLIGPLLEMWAYCYLRGKPVSQEKSILDKILKRNPELTTFSPCQDATDRLYYQMMEGKYVLVDGYLISFKTRSGSLEVQERKSMIESCPFCGSDELEISYRNWSGEIYPILKCFGCGIGFEKGWTKKELLKAWNRRKNG